MKYIDNLDGTFTIDSINNYFENPIIINPNLNAILHKGALFESISKEEWNTLCKGKNTHNLQENQGLYATYKRTFQGYTNCVDFEEKMQVRIRQIECANNTPGRRTFPYL